MLCVLTNFEQKLTLLCIFTSQVWSLLFCKLRPPASAWLMCYWTTASALLFLLLLLLVVPRPPTRSSPLHPSGDFRHPDPLCVESKTFLKLDCYYRLSQVKLEDCNQSHTVRMSVLCIFWNCFYLSTWYCFEHNLKYLLCYPDWLSCFYLVKIQ